MNFHYSLCQCVITQKILISLLPRTPSFYHVLSDFGSVSGVLLKEPSIFPRDGCATESVHFPQNSGLLSGQHFPQKCFQLFMRATDPLFIQVVWIFFPLCFLLLFYYYRKSYNYYYYYFYIKLPIGTE